MTRKAAVDGSWLRSSAMSWRALGVLTLAVAVAPGLGGCIAGGEDGEGDELVQPGDPGGKADGYGGFRDPGWDVWQPVHTWTDLAPNGETYEEYYATWLASIEYDEGSYRSENVRFVLGDGTVVPAPSLECADTAMFLRFLYAEEFGLPMVVYGGNEVFGHFGWVDASGNRKRSYAQYKLNAARGSDRTLQGINRYLPDRFQDYPVEGATTGQYLDAILKNKRFGVFMQDVWNMLYSGNLGERSNSYYVKPEFIRGGDLQLHRTHPWEGIGHTITIQNVKRLNDSLLSVDLIQSYMPTEPWISDGYSELTGYQPDPATNGGLRRWRRPVLRGGRWYLEADSSVGNPDSEVGNNPDRFEDLFKVDAQEQVQALLGTINANRAALQDNPNSCRRRENRETAFESLYELYRVTPELYEPLGFTVAPSADEIRRAVDRQYRTIEDFIWAEMHYEGAWVCHWNPANTTVNRSMYAAVVAYNRQVALANGCQGIRMFRSQNVDQNDGSDGFDDLATWARANGYQWDDYRLDPAEGDEGGALRSVVTDELADPNLVEYFCSIYADLEYWQS